MTTFRALLIYLVLIVVSQSALANIVLTAPPREDVKAGKKVYGPIAAELTKVLGETVTYKHPDNWVQYANDMRAGKYDIVFDGPHFASWRMKHVGHVPLVRLSGNLQFYILAKKNDKKLAVMKDLLGKSFCGLASPNLGTMSAFDLYNNPIVQPEIQVVRGGMREVMKKFLSGECRAAVVRDKLYKKLSAEEKAKIRIIAKSRKMPNQSITVGSRVDEKNKRIIQKFLTSDKGSGAADNLLKRFSKKKKYFIPTKNNEFNELTELLEGVVYGW